MTEPLSPKELAALSALMAAKSIAEAAAAAGVDERTVRRYLTREPFKAALREAQAASVQASATALANACAKAVQRLEDVIDDDEAPQAAQVAAARTILMLSRKDVVDADMAARLEALEAQQSAPAARRP